MATYYAGLSSQRENLQSPYPGDQKLASYSEHPSHHSNMTVYLNHASAAGSYSEFLSGSSLSSHNCAEFLSVGDRNEMVFIPPTSDTMNLQSIDGHIDTSAGNPVGNPVNGDPQVVSRTQVGILGNDLNAQSQGLSLSLGTEMQSAISVPSFQYQNPNVILPSFSSLHLPILGKWMLSCEGDESNQSKGLKSSECLLTFGGGNHTPIKAEVSRNPQCLDSHRDIHTDAYMYQPSSYANAITNSKFLKAAQQLLDKVVSVRKVLKQPPSDKCLDETKETDAKANKQSIPLSSSGMSSGPKESIANSSSELSPAERQDLQNKKTKLLSILDEVDRRYRQYYNQMQLVVSSFDMVAGHGAAKSYTALALQTISRHFRCLRDAISSQIEIVRKSLGEEDTSANGQGGIPRLRYVDQQLRQQRALRQLGVMRHAWRPQRGLPESSVSILRAWLFEHFLHPYPNDSEKIMLAKQTGLSRNQVANWFINARVRLWKPMVEEIYKEEFGDLEANSRSSQDDDATKALGENQLASDNRLDELQDSLTSAAADGIQTGQVYDRKPDRIPDVEMKRPMGKTVLQNCSHVDNIIDTGIMKFQHEFRSNMDDHSSCPDKNTPLDPHGVGSLMPGAFKYDISALSEFAIGSQVSLALGLQQHESDAFPMAGGNHIRSSNMATSSMGADTVDYHCMDSGKQQDRFGSSHLLHDFVV
ncbi:BEL1-like homeodomain protein 3 isoform X1 [Ricinus communis]|uniref:BEL1-like homeodomain protein 3 isoform X1 n=2 Tax=Ricinus communis TaxID=3988 RepID=UPI00201A865A|nr:BEL1-like homeodomain protein 3 isoform X1 [Ricinus communis]XP_015576237.2 BEL1-like homeodomain protein 3 isoform X1 [Ricinus communis]XP_025012697.2 BEL1-like homeodomain protein 3 isoform X1 [Ricinus communis]